MDRCEPKWTGRGTDSAAERILFLEFSRQTKTYRAAIEMARIGYGEQAAMLNRALFESMIILRWIDANGEAAVQQCKDALRWTSTSTASG
jgi:hypothetical protein